LSNQAKKRVAIVQSNYIPWKGYFDLIHSVDEFILYDDMQYTRRDWRNRNKIKTPQGAMWLTIPVDVKGKYFQKIRDTTVSDRDWADAHWKSIRQFYIRAPYFQQYRDVLETLYLDCKETSLSAINYRFLVALCGMLDIPTKLTWSMDYSIVEGKTERLVDLCKQAGAGVYLSGPAARDYIDAELFAQAGIDLVFFDYSGYPEYHQLFPPFAHDVSVIDLLLNEGPAAPQFMKSFRSPDQTAADRQVDKA
jgi:WbqC-like protein family